MNEIFKVEAFAVRDLGLRDAKDLKIFEAARQAGAVVMTKDKDFVNLLDRFGPPPQIIWLTLGNTSNHKLKEVLKLYFQQVRILLEQKEPIIEIMDAE